MQNILFVCVHNANRSQMAEAFFNAQAGALGLDIHAESAGIRGCGALNSLTVRAMEEVGVPMEGQVPKQLKAEMVERAGRIVTMGADVDREKCPAKYVASDSWLIADPSGQTFAEVRRVRDEIRSKVDSLVTSLVAD